MKDTPAVVGAAVHNGWAELVTVSVHDRAPVVLDRRRVELVDSDVPNNPYHHEALDMELGEAEALISRVRRCVAERAYAAVSELRSVIEGRDDRLKTIEHRSVVAITVPRSPFDRLPDGLDEVLRSWRLTCAADGMMYREAVAQAGADLTMEVIRYPRKVDEAQMAADALDVARDAIVTLTSNLGKPLGAPWRREHRNATAAALTVLSRCVDVRV